MSFHCKIVTKNKISGLKKNLFAKLCFAHEPQVDNNI